MTLPIIVGFVALGAIVVGVIAIGVMVWVALYSRTQENG